MGTLLQAAGLPTDIPPELWNLENPEAVERIQREYVLAGAQILTSNTFGSSKLKLSAFGLETKQKEIITAAVKIARSAANGKAIAVAGDIGPLGVFLQPFGELTFDEAYREFCDYAEALWEAGSDFIIIETMTDLVELKAAILAVRDATPLPIIASFSFDEGDRSVTGTPPEVYAAVVNALHPAAFGTNCGMGIEPVIEAVGKMRPYTDLPILAEPSAGLPKIIDGETVFPASPGEMADAAIQMWDFGANIIGSCCGSTPEHTAKIADAVRGKDVKTFARKRGFFAASRVKLVRIAEDKPVRLVGERINPSGRKKFKQRLVEGDMGAVKLEVVRQDEADILDICVAAPGVDEVDILPRAVAAAANITDKPLFIDSMNTEAITLALKLYPGLPVLNSISAKSDEMENLLAIAAHWGAGFIALAMDDEGIPQSAAERVSVIKEIIHEAEIHGIDKNRIIADPVMLPVSASADNPQLTLESINALYPEQIPAIIGLSNVSYGLPARSMINAAMLANAIAQNIAAVIADPTDKRIIETLYSAGVLSGSDPKARAFVNKFGTVEHTAEDEPISESLRDDIIRGNVEWVPGHVADEIQMMSDPLLVLNKIVIPAIRDVGTMYEEKKIYLPQVISAAEATIKARECLRPKFPKDKQSRGRILLATVHGDVHDIGKNLVRALLESHGFDVDDIGKNVDTGTIIEKLAVGDYVAVGLSALMTTTLQSMEETVTAILAEYSAIAVIVGGAAVDEEFAARIGARYAHDAVAAARVAEDIVRRV